MTPIVHAPANVADFRFRVAGGPEDELRVTAFEGAEAISELFEFRVRLCCEDGSIDPQTMIGLAAVLEIDGEHGVRRVCGVIRRFERTGAGPRWTHYAAHLVPPHWLLTRRIQSRVFNRQRCPRTDVPGIVAQVLADAGLSPDDLVVATAYTYEPREFTVQYRESDWDFICRLLEEEGIYWFFEHEGERPRLVLMDSKDLHRPFHEPDCDVPFRERSDLLEEHEFVFDIRTGDEVQIGAAALDDFDFRQPAGELIQRVRGDRFTALELSDYPGDFRESARGQRLVRARLEEHQCRRRVVTMAATIRNLLPGRRFRLIEHAEPRLNDDYLVTAITHRATQSQSADAEAGDEGTRYDVEIGALPAGVQFRPSRSTPRPTVAGSQTAIVVGPPGEEIHTDEFGRVEVRFHWDRQAEFDAGASCWIRVSQAWAGGQYGTLFLPRVGQEVIVDFLEGDPDKPIITGRVYNRDHMPPYRLPDERTISAIRTCSSPGAGGGNELRFDDARGREQVLLFGQNSLHLRSRGNQYESVGGEGHRTVHRDDHELVRENKHTTVRLDRIEQTDGNLHVRVEKDSVESVMGRKTTHVMKKYAILNAEGIVLESDTSISICVKGNFIRIDESGVTIMGKTVQINSGGSADTWQLDAPDTPTLPLPAATTAFGRNCTYHAETSSLDALQPGAAPVRPPEDVIETQNSWIEIELVDDFGRPCRGEAYVVAEPDGTEHRGALSERGTARVAVKTAGVCRISFPNIDAAVWDRATPAPPPADLRPHPAAE